MFKLEVLATVFKLAALATMYLQKQCWEHFIGL